MIKDFKKIEDLFNEINDNLNEKINVFMIGGGMLLFHGLKSATKDIDLIISNKEEFNILQTTLERMNFDKKIPTDEYKRMELNQIFSREDFRIDVFHKVVCKKFQLSEQMIKRAEKIIELNNLNLFICSKEDVFLFKTFTEREGDLEDCISLAKRGLEWNQIIDELKNQINLSGNDVWITWVGERFDILQDKGLNIPIMEELNKLRDKFFDELEKNLKD